MKLAPSDPPEIHRELWGNVGGGYLGWDIGANCGRALNEMIVRFTRVMAFEPAEECWRYLQQWRGRVETFPYAISDRDGDIELAGLPDEGARTVPARSIDSLLNDGFDRPDFIKLNVEGHEGRVLAGAKQSLHMFRPQWLIEFHTAELREDCLDVLLQHSYRVETIRHPHYATGSDQWHQHGWLKAVFPS